MTLKEIIREKTSEAMCVEAIAGNLVDIKLSFDIIESIIENEINDAIAEVEELTFSFIENVENGELKVQLKSFPIWVNMKKENNKFDIHVSNNPSGINKLRII